MPGVAAYIVPPAATQSLRLHVVLSVDNKYPPGHVGVHEFATDDQTNVPPVKVPVHVQAVEPATEVELVPHLLHVDDA